MEIEEIRQRLDALSEAAKSRRLGCDGLFPPRLEARILIL